MGAKEYDVLVIGGGPAGYMAAIKAARLGARTALAEKDELGGTCLNRGCIPAKTLLKTAELIHEIAGAAGRGITIADPRVSVDMPAVIKGKNRVVKRLTSGVASLLASNGVELLRGEGRLLAPGRIAVAGLGEAVAKKLILAGGSQAAKLPIPGLELPGVLTSTDILDIEETPPRLAIIGGGVIGVEMAMIFQSFGSKVSIVEALPRILPFMDAEAAALIHKTLQSRGAEIYTGTGLSRIEQKGGGLSLVLTDGKSLPANKALVSIGRTGDLSCLGDLAVRTEKGKVLVDDCMETSVPGIFAPGDINGKKMLAHAAFKMAEIAAENAVAPDRQGMKKADLRFVPSVVYSFPEAAAVGLTQEEAEREGPVLAGKFPLAANGRALAAGDAGGFVKVLADKKYGAILGVHIVGPGAAEIINEAAALMSMEITVHELAGIVHGHPTVSEALMEAAADCLGQCLHLPPKKRAE
ncbi:MAG: dihydrolipoyl dehydrogenase [Spirochaetaceae bacterium]|jgi:dihydrolipoamide dehydrogenase|nr:dihydrolipoyl dehydrogenase [Spirochaetaceae bacterium]